MAGLGLGWAGVSRDVLCCCNWGEGRVEDTGAAQASLGTRHTARDKEGTAFRNNDEDSVQRKPGSMDSLTPILSELRNRDAMMILL